jgi:hydroxyacylglutathione hydrolase
MKKKQIDLGIICLFMFLLPLPAQVYKNADLQISKLGDHSWVIETTDFTTMYLIEGSEKSLLIDTGTKCDSLDLVISRITKKPVMVVLTHAHDDHAGNIRFFKDIYLHPADTVLLQKDYGGKLHFIDEGSVFDLGGKKIDVHYMPAHTPGSIILVDKDAKVCYTGDAFGSGQVWLQLRPLAPMKTYVNSCSKMLELMDQGIEKIYCGHYYYAKGALDKDYILRMKKLALSLEEGHPVDPKPYSIKASIGTDTPMIVEDGQTGIVYDPDHIK